MSRKRLEREMLAVNIRNLSDEDDDVRLMAIEALVTSTWDPEWNPEGMIEEGGLPAVVHCLGDENPRIRSAAASLLLATAERGDGDAVVLADALPGLERLTGDRDEIVRIKANEVIQVLQTQGCF
jgi:HEAT repeat protein